MRFIFHRILLRHSGIIPQPEKPFPGELSSVTTISRRRDVPQELCIYLERVGEVAFCSPPFSTTASAAPRSGQMSLLRWSDYSRSTVTGASPDIPSRCAAAGVTSMMRPRTNGPRSLTVTTTERPLL
jgi:hypothetical protein